MKRIEIVRRRWRWAQVLSTMAPIGCLLILLSLYVVYARRGIASQVFSYSAAAIWALFLACIALGVSLQTRTVEALSKEQDVRVVPLLVEATKSKFRNVRELATTRLIYRLSEISIADWKQIEVSDREELASTLHYCNTELVLALLSCFERMRDVEAFPWIKRAFDERRDLLKDGQIISSTFSCVTKLREESTGGQGPGRQD